jgi:farnesol kinase
MSQALIPGRAKSAKLRSGDAVVNSVLLSLPVFRPLAARIGLSELRRRLTHISPGFLPFLLWVLPHPDPWGPVLIDCVVVLAVGIVGLALYRFRSIARSGEEQGIAAVVGYAVPIIVMLLAFPGRAELGLMTLAIVAIGDGSATLGGLLLRGRRLPWNREKTLAGFCSFCLFGTLMATVIYWGESRPSVSWEAALACAGAATLIAALVESLPIPWNDNFRVGATAAIVGVVVQILWLGR